MQYLPEQLRPSTTNMTSAPAAWDHDGHNSVWDAPPDYDADEQPTLLDSGRQLIGLARRHWFAVLTSVAIAVLFAFLVIHRSVPVYRAKAVIRLQNKTQQMAGGLGVATGSDMLGRTADPILSQVQVLESREIADKVVGLEGLRLRSLSRGFRWASLDSVHVDDAAPRDTLVLHFSATGVVAVAGSHRVSGPYGTHMELNGVSFTPVRAPAVPEAQFVVVPHEAAVAGVTARLKGDVRERTDVVDVTYTAPDPVLAARTANAAVAVFQQSTADAARQQSVRRRQFIADQLVKTEALLAAAQAQHNAFRQRQHVYSSDATFQATQVDLTSLEMRRRELDANRRLYSGLLAEVDSLPPGAERESRLSALVSSPGIAENSVVAQLFGALLHLEQTRDSLTAGAWGSSGSNPDVQRVDGLISLAKAQLMTAVRGQIAAAQAQIASLDDLTRKTSSQMQSLPATESEEARLLAQVQAYQDAAGRLRDQLQKAEIDEAAEAGDVVQVDSATAPRLPIGSGRMPKVAFALVVGLLVGLGTAYLLENYRIVVRQRDDLTRVIASPNLAVIPRIRSLSPRSTLRPGKITASTNGDIPKDLIVAADLASAGAEAYRTLRSNLLFSLAVRPARRIVITSASPGEGKSTTAANLAVAFAQQGKRVLLIDADLRRPRVHSLFNRPQQPGLTTVLVGESSLQVAAQTTEIPGLWILASGPMPPNPVELLASPRMHEALETEGFDIVLIDSPPLLIGADASVLSREADGVVLVVRAGRTAVAALREAVLQLRHAGARVVGTVLNDPEAALAHYADYGYQGYQQAYGAYAPAVNGKS